MSPQIQVTLLDFMTQSHRPQKLNSKAQRLQLAYVRKREVISTL